MKKRRGRLKPAPVPSLPRAMVGMEIEEESEERFHSIENDLQKRLRLLAFRDFCFDLFEEEYGKILQEKRPILDLSKASLSRSKATLCIKTDPRTENKRFREKPKSHL